MTKYPITRNVFCPTTSLAAPESMFKNLPQTETQSARELMVCSTTMTRTPVISISNATMEMPSSCPAPSPWCSTLLLEAAWGKNRPARKRDDVMEKRCLRLTDSNVLEEKLLVLKICCKLILSTLIQQIADLTSPATTTRNQTSLVAAKEMFLLLIHKLASQPRRFLSVLVGMSVLRTASVQMTVMLTAPAQSTNIICLFIESKLFEEKYLCPIQS